MNPGEFPHSEISGSMLICSSPKLIAAYHVFHRLPVPRHSPCALVRLTFQTFFQNIWYPLDSLCQRRLLLPFLLKLQYFLKELTIIFVSQLLFSFQGTSLSVLFRALKIEQYLLRLYLSPVPDVRPSSMFFHLPDLRKEVIQPQVLLRLPCYDFTPITSFTFGGVLLAVRLPTSGPLALMV